MKLLLDVLLFLAYALFSGLSLVLLKLGLADFKLNFIAIIRNVNLTVGFVGYIIGFVLWMFILSKFYLNVAFPIAMSLFFIISLIGSYYILREPISLNQILGIILCFLGILLINLK